VLGGWGSEASWGRGTGPVDVVKGGGNRGMCVSAPRRERGERRGNAAGLGATSQARMKFWEKACMRG
jgi:hypothetical protein